MSFTGVEILTRNCTNCNSYKDGWCVYYDQDVTMDDEPCGRWENDCIALLNESSDRNEWPISVTILSQKYDLTAEEAIRLRDYLDRCIRRVAPEVKE